RNGRADPLPFLKTCVLALLLVDGLFEFRPRCELGDFAGGNFDGSAGLRVAAVSRLPLRHREGAETNQGNAVSLAESGSNAVDSGINGGGSLRFADLARACDLVNQIGFVHSFSSQVSFIPSVHREEIWLWLSWET